MNDLGRAPLDLGTLAPGDRIRHPQFGTAVVRVVGKGIVTARFDGGVERKFLTSHPRVQRLDPFEEGRISPPWGEIDDPERFLPALTPGELQLARYLDGALPRDWRIYVRPHLDADRPLLTALHRTAGGMFWDVVDWDLSTFCVEDGLWVSAGRRFASPYRFMNEVRRRVYGVYVPEIGEALNADNHVYSVITAALYFSRATTAQAAQLAAGDPAARRVETIGSDALDPSTPRRVAPALGRQDRLRSGWFEGLDAALTHARRMPDALSLIRLTPEQQRRSTSRPGYTAVEGVAGSGKTLILAHRAAAAAADGRRALLLTYNRTLTNYVRALLRHTPFAFSPDRLTVLHFHELCRRIHDHHEEPLPPVRRLAVDDVDQQAFEVDWPESARNLLSTRGVPAALRFDLVLIDEGQDFGPEWLGLIAQLGASEVVMAHDLGQRLYDREDGLSSREIARLFGIAKTRAAPMRKVIRLPAATVRLASDYAERWSLATAPLEVADDGLLPSDATITGVPAETRAAAAAGAVALLDAWRQAPDFRARDVAIVVPEVNFGSALVRLLAERGISSNHVFPVASTGALIDDGLPLEGEEAWRISQAQKTAFAYADSRLKVSTVHSFKGWEALRVCLVLPFGRPTPQKASVAYVGLTRSSGDLAVVGRLQDFGLDGLPGPIGREIVIDPHVALRFRALLDDTAAATSGTAASAAGRSDAS